MSARETILRRIRNNLGCDDSAAGTVEKRLGAREAGPRPQRSRLPHSMQVDLFAEMAEEVDATVARVEGNKAILDAIADYLSAHNLPARLVVSPDGRLDDVPWEERPTLEIRRGIAVEMDSVSVTPAFAGIAETGTVMAISGKGTPTTLNFLPENHIVILRESEIVGTYEDGWQRLRQQTALSGDVTSMPRTVNFITGPSRTADIAMTLYLGAHGPRRLHIILVADDGG